MALHLIIDGYNLIRQSKDLSCLDLQDLQMGREALLDRLAAYKRIKGHRITVVFDGAGAPMFTPQQDRVKGIRVRFSRQGELADTVIKRMAAREQQKAVVVSSDRDVIAHCQSKGAAVMSAPEFEDRMMMAQYMDIKGVEPDDAESGWVPTTQKKGPTRRISKKARRNLRKTTKL